MPSSRKTTGISFSCASRSSIPRSSGPLIKTFLVDANLLVWGTQEKMRDEHRCNVPWAILLDPTSACNLHCTGCWAAEYGHSLNLSYDDIDSIIRQGKELGVHVYIYTGGEPLVRKRDLIRLCEAHPAAPSSASPTRRSSTRTSARISSA